MAYPGLYIDMVPKDGGNRFSGVMFGDFTYEPWSASNLTPELQRAVPRTLPRSTISPTSTRVCGPIRKDRLWFYAALRYEALDVSVVNDYYDKNPSPYLYEADLSRPAHDSGIVPNESVRLTWQATQKNKVQFWFTNQNKAREFYNIASNVTPDAREVSTRVRQPITLKWSRPQTNKLLFEGACGGAHLFRQRLSAECDDVLDRATIQAVPIYSITDLANNKIFGAPSPAIKPSAGYVCRSLRDHLRHRSHALKAGIEASSARDRTGSSWYTGDLTMTFNAGVPRGHAAHPNRYGDGYSDLQLFVQDR